MKYVMHMNNETIRSGFMSILKRLNAEEIIVAVHEGTSERVRPIAMTTVAVISGLLPIMFGSGTGSEVMQRIAAPMVGGIITTTLLCLLVIPVIYGWVLQWQEKCKA